MHMIYEAWDLAHGHISTPIPLIATSPTPALEQTRAFWWQLWPQQHVGVVVDYTDATIKSR